MKRILLTTICLLLTSAIGVAQGHHPTAPKSGVRIKSTNICSQSPTLVPDGTTSGYEDYITASGTAYYYQNFQGGHSYSVDVWDPFDLYQGFALSLSLLNPNDCSAGPTYTDVTKMSPNMSGTVADRISFIQPTDGAQQIGLTNPDSVNPYDFYIRITETTLLNPRWSTFSGFITQYAFVNNTSFDIVGTLTLTDSSGTQFTAISRSRLGD